jgi:serine/threonine protein kinase
MNNLSHQYIVKLHEALPQELLHSKETCRSVHAIVMELAQGGSLEQRLVQLGCAMH